MRRWARFRSKSREEARRAGREPFLIGVVGATDPAIEAYPHVWVRMGEVGKLFAALRARRRRRDGDRRRDGAARIRRPQARLGGGRSERRGWRSFSVAATTGFSSALAAIVEREGIRVVGAHEVAPGLLAPLGPFGARTASPEDEADIALGVRLIEALSSFDAGQGAVVAAGRVLAIEAAEGTDAMLARVAEMRASGRLRFSGQAGVLVKAPKRGQDLRLDMPAIGPKTIEGAAKAQLRGVAVAAGRVLIVERERLAREADAAGLFVAGFASAGAAR